MNRRTGLTLVELVVVMVLLLFIGLSVGGLVRTVKDTEQSINRTTEMNQTGRVVLQRLASELSSALPLPVVVGVSQATLTTATEFGSAQMIGSETSEPSVLTFYHEDAADLRSGIDLDTIRFTTANADPRRSPYPQADTIEVAYFIDTDPQTPEQGLVRSVGPLPGLLPEDALIDQSQTTEVLSERIVSLNFRFYDSDTGEWLDTWDYTDVLPALVEITIGVAPASCDEFLAQLDKDQSALSFVEWLTTTVPIRVRSYPDPSVQQQQQWQATQVPLPSGQQQPPSQQPQVPATQPSSTMPQLPPVQIPTQRPSGTQMGVPAQRPSAPSFQIPQTPFAPSQQQPTQQRPTTGVRPQQGGGRR